MKRLIVATTAALCLLMTFPAAGLAIDIEIGGGGIEIRGGERERQEERDVQQERERERREERDVQQERERERREERDDRQEREKERREERDDRQERGRDRY